MLLKLLKPLFELSHLFGQMAYLIGIPTAWFLPGLLCGVEGFIYKNLLTAAFVEPTTLVGVLSRERPVNSLATLAVRPFLGAPLLGPPPCVRFPFLGTCSTAPLRAVATLALLARAASFAFSAKSFSIFSRSTSMALGDSGTNACVSAY